LVAGVLPNTPLEELTVLPKPFETPTSKGRKGQESGGEEKAQT